MFKVKIHPTFILLSLILCFQGKFVVASAYIFAVLFHEAGHFFAAKRRGYAMDEITLMPYGAVLYGWEKIEKRNCLAIAFGGVFASGALCLLLCAAWWIFPASYYFTSELFRASMTITVVNLLPAFPLDGARIILSFFKDVKKPLSVLRGVGVALSVCMFVASIVTVSFGFNFSLAVLSIFLFAGAVSGTEKEKYYHLFERVRPGKAAAPVEVKRLLLQGELTLLSVLSKLDVFSVYEFEIVDENMRKIASVSEDEMRRAFLEYPLRKRIKDIFVA